jgi:L-aspartate oxidase
MSRSSGLDGDDRIIVVGGGIAGLATALSLAPAPVTLVSRAGLGTEAATCWAQGGIAAALGPDDDPGLHADDTVAAGAGLTAASIARRVASDAAACIDALIGWGVRFDRDPSGNLALGLEAAHSRRRIVHAGGDASGAAILTALARSASAAPSIEVMEGVAIVDLALDDDGAVAGVIGARGGRRFLLPARAVVLATGGVGGLYASTTNPLGAVGSGLALCARAGAVLRDLEFVQFHPTAIALGQDPMPLATEAIRGEGGVLINGRGERFMADVPGRELASRDVVARAIWAQIEAGQRVFLDARAAIGAGFAERFPTVAARCRAAGLDPATEPIPVRPAAHFHMGGVRVDQNGRTSVPGLWACGEVAATGLHGANRLASNSLLEAVASARYVAADIQGQASRQGARLASAPETNGRFTGARPPAGPGSYTRIRRLMDNAVGVIRNEAALRNALVQLDDLAARDEAMWPSASLALVGLLIAAAALLRTESRGAHFRSDYPRPAPGWQRHTDLTLDDARALAASLRTAPAELVSA